jgi:hypothetical protein
MAAPNTYSTATQLFLADLARNLFASNQCLQYSRNWNASAKGKTVNWNQSGVKANVVIDRDTVALTVGTRPDTLRSYTLHEFQSIPVKIDWTEEMIINYSKRQDVIQDHLSGLLDDIAMRILYNWASGAKTKLRTTGADVAANLRIANGTGTRKKLTLADILAARRAMNKDNVPDDGQRVLVVPPEMEMDLLEIQNLLDSTIIGTTNGLVNGAIVKIYGFNVFMRSQLPFFDHSDDAMVIPKAADTLTPTATTSDSCNVAIAWHPQFVSRAIAQESLVVIKQEHGGTEFSATMLAGGSRFYSDGRGIAIIAEGI